MRILLESEMLNPDEFEWEDVVTGTIYAVKKGVDQKNEDIPYYCEAQLSIRRPLVKDARHLQKLFCYIYNEKYNESEFFDAKKASGAFYLMLGIDRSFHDSKVILIKGGAYKIKNYYMENDKIKDIRGASSLLTFVTEYRIPDVIQKKFIKECMIYEGGGNFLAVIPKDKLPTEEEIGIFINALEDEFDKCTVTVEYTFAYLECNLRDVLSDYKATMCKLDQKIQEIKKSKIYNFINPRVSLGEKILFPEGGNTLIQAEPLKEDYKICTKCHIKNAGYSYEKEEVCGSCLHKAIVGKNEKKGYLKKMQYYLRKKGTDIGRDVARYYFDKPPQDFGEIRDSRDTIAVLYGDGNNIGSIVQNITSIYEMMQFSRKANEAARKATYEALFHNNTDGDKLLPFEVIALGGDDIFFITPGNKAVKVAQELIRIFNDEFRNRSTNKYTATMSIGIVIARYNNPIKISFDLVQKYLKSAKKEERKQYLKGHNCGSIDIAVIEGTSNIVPFSSDSMLPMDSDSFENFMQLIKECKRLLEKTGIFNLMQAALTMEQEEYDLFLDYYIAKLDTAKEYDKYKKALLTKIKNNNIKPWKDILTLWDYC